MKPLNFSSPPQRILIIKPSAIGDIVHALPVLNLLRRRWPVANISWLVSSSCASLLEGHSQINELIHFDRHHYGKGWRSPSALVELFRFARSLRERQFDLVIDLQGLFRSGWLAKQTGAPIRVGPADAREFGWIYYTHPVEPHYPRRHAVERYLDIADAMGLGREPVEFVFATNDEDREVVASLIPPGRRFAVLLPGANWRTKRWPADRFAGLVAPMRQSFGLESVIAGGSADGALADQIPGAIDLTGRTNLRQLGALMERAELVIGNDTGPLHIAAALGRPMVSLFGPTNPDFTGPFGRMNTVVRHAIECSPCLSRSCPHQSCLRGLDVSVVITAAGKQLN